MSPPMACFPFPLPLLQQSVLPQQRYPPMLYKFLLNGQLYNVAFLKALAQVLVKLYPSYCKFFLFTGSSDSQVWPQLPPLCLKSTFLARHFDHVTLSHWVISLVPPFSWQSPRVRIPAEDLPSMTTCHQLPSLMTPEHLRLHDLSLWTRCIKGTGEHIRD